MDQKKIGEFIFELRTSANYTQKQLGDMVGVTDNSVSKWERGINLPDVYCIRKLAEIFNVTEQEILSGERIINLTDIKDELNKKYKQKGRKIFIIAMIIVLVLSIITLLPPDPLTLEEVIYANIFFAVVTYFGVKMFCFFAKKYEYKKITKCKNMVIEKKIKTKKEITVNSDNKKIKIILLILFILTLLSIFIALLIPIFITRNNIPINDIHFLPGFKVNMFKIFTISYNTAFVAPYTLNSLIALIIPILSIILGFIYRRRGYRCTKNIVGGIVISVFIFLIAIGSSISDFKVKKDYSKISGFTDIINLPVPSKGSFYQATDMEGVEYSYFAFKDKNGISNLENSIRSNTLWLTEDKVDYRFNNILINGCTKNNCYYMVYNIDTSEYNTIPVIRGKYHLYTMMYDPTTKVLKIISLIAKN